MDRQFYFPDTNVLITRFMTADGVVELQDFMPVSERQRRPAGHLRPRPDAPALRLQARFDYARAPTRTRRSRDGVVFDRRAQARAVRRWPLQTDSGDVSAEFAVSEGETVTFVLHVGDSPTSSATERDGAGAVRGDRGVLADWLRRSTYGGAGARWSTARR